MILVKSSGVSKVIFTLTEQIVIVSFTSGCSFLSTFAFYDVILE